MGDSVCIRAIDKTTVNRICSGQVVLTLATAVKELLENSIDAGANSIQIKLEDYGSKLIEVIDNGSGVEEANFQALTLKHHTSKIKEFTDLCNVETFGFRGEALSSLCSLSDVTIITQHKNAVVGATLKFDHNGIITSNTKTLRKVGTSVRLENIFSPLPVRKIELVKNLKREFSKLCNTLYAYGMQSVGVRITCTNQVSKTNKTKNDNDNSIKTSSKTTIMDTKGESVESNIISIFGTKQKQNLIQITEVQPSQQTLNEFGLENKIIDFKKFKLSGYISSCAHGCGRSSSDRQFYYINSRPVDNSKVSKLVNDVYHQYNNKQDPFVVLNIQVSSGSFDVNVTPDKRQILLENETVLLAILKESLLSVFKIIPATLEVQNVGLMSSMSSFLSSQEDVSFSERPEKFKSWQKSSSGRNDIKNQANSRIDNLLKFRLQSKLSPLSPEKKVTSSSQKFEITPKTKLTNRNVIFTTPVRETAISKSESLIENCNVSENPKKEDSVKNTKVIELSYCREDSIQKSELEVLESVSKDYKRKLEEKNDKVKNEDSESKRLKLDEGLEESAKKNRKCVEYKTDISDIKEIRKKTEISSNNTDVGSVKFLAEIKPQNNERAQNELTKEIKKESFSKMEIIGQFNLGFIITKLDSDIFIIDQHASDEKYNYETLQSTTVMQTQKLFNPEKLELTVDKEELMLEHRDVIKKNGFDFVYDENEAPTKRISLTAIPFSKNTVFGKDDVYELLFFLDNAPEFKTLRPSRVSSMFASRACRKSVMIGTPLNQQEMRRIVNHMGEIEQPWNCPHGRPTMRHLLNLHMIHSKEDTLS